MARGRMLDREFYHNIQLSELDVQVRYLYIGTIVFADDDGRLRAHPKYLKALIYPLDEVIRTDTVKSWRDQLAACGLIQVYAAGDQEYLVHPNWSKWQTIRKDRYTPSDCPSPSPKCNHPDKLTQTSNSTDDVAQNDNQAVTSAQPSGNQRLPQPNLTKPNLTKDNNNDNGRGDKDNDITPYYPPVQAENDASALAKSKAGTTKNKFVKPTSEEITQYAKLIDFELDGNQFWNYYESKNWHVGKNRMTNWQAAVRTWKIKHAQNNKSPTINQSVKAVILGFRNAKNVPEADRENWFKTFAGRYAKPAQELLNYFNGKWEPAVDCIQDLADKMQAKGLDWGWTAVFNHAQVYKNQSGR